MLEHDILDKKITIWDINLFTLVAQTLSFKQSANILGISPGYVTKRIILLESTLKTTLLVRTTRQVSLSKSGELFLLKAKSVLKDIEDAIADINALKKTTKGNVKVCCDFSLGKTHVGDIISILCSSHPELNIHLELSTSKSDIGNDDYDIYILAGEVNQPNLVAYELTESYRVICASPLYLKRQGNLNSVEELKYHNCLIHRSENERFGIWKLTNIKAMEEYSIKVRGSLSSNHDNIVKSWAMRHKGIAMLPIWDIKTELESGILLRILPNYQQNEKIYAVIKSQEKKTHMIKLCVGFIKDQFSIRLPSPSLKPHENR
ncbi:LysR substrate-binding domain-containing protein [Serratia marcescens]|uniref:LysR substrate-binding domain-containing protein n=1 Tax=Serratia marcescens TaxID=615 RepID=UPI003896A6F3